MKNKAIKQICRDALFTVFIIALCTAVALALSRVDNDNNPFASMLYILGVALIARFTSGFLYGAAASVISVLCVNYVFTYPFYTFNLSLKGYPLTFTVMLCVSVLVSAMSAQLKRQERLRFEAKNEAMRANLLRSVSHDLRTPLASILGASSVLLNDRELGRSEREEMLLGIQKDARWLTRVTENLLSVTKLNNDGVTLKTQDEVVEEIVGSATVKFRRHGDALPVMVSAPDEILLVSMDATLIEQVLINLFENVQEHAGTATRISLDIARCGERVVFAVSDDGQGLDESIIPRLFDGDIVTQGQVSADGRRSMGIGLSVCRTIVQAHGGGMSAKNNESGGATVEFWLPYGGDGQ